MNALAIPARIAILALLAAPMFHGAAALGDDLLAADRFAVTRQPPPLIAGGRKDPLGPEIDFAWRKDGFRIQPYGAFWADMIYATQRTSPGAFTLFVFSSEDQGEDTFTIDARRTRLGLNVSGPRFGTAETGGRVEIDFQGSFITENRASVLLRHAYWEAKDDRTRLLVGQYWDVASPLNPGTLNAGYGYFAGNIGFRRAQFRAERQIAWSENVMVSLQGSLNAGRRRGFPNRSRRSS